MNQAYEQKIRQAGFKRVIGIDEVGRGAWAGPLVAAGVIFDSATRIQGLKDSKKLDAASRSELDLEIRSKALFFHLEIIDNLTIDQIGIGQANELIVQKIVEAAKPDFALIDQLWLSYLPSPFELIIKGDAKVFSIAAASIIAKVYRDKIMSDFDEQYPGYNFKNNKGYGTNDHQIGLEKLSYCPIHRQSYQPVMQKKLFS